MLSASQISKSYDSLQVLKQVDLEVKEGEVVTIVGASGAGKSTLLHILGSLDKADSGSVTINGIQTQTLSDRALAQFRNEQLGFIFQFHHLLPEFTALENVCIPGWIGKRDRKAVEKRAKDLLGMLNLSSRLTHRPKQLSGGEQQRVAVARALINSPHVVFADEPSGNLDSQNATELHDLFFQLRAEFNQTFVIVTHNEGFAEMADRKLVMQDGNFISL